MTGKRVLGFLSLGLLIFAFMFSVTTPSEYCMGDNILRALGLKAWSKESIELRTNGFHYTFLFSLAFAVLGYAGSTRFLKELYPKLVNSLSLVVLILFFTSTPLFTWGYGVALSFSQGINAVDYLPAPSNCYYTSNKSDKLIPYSYQITLKNYSHDAVKFNMQVQKPGHWDTMMDVTKTNEQGKRTLKEFVLEADEQRQFSFIIEGSNPEKHAITGSINSPNITLFDQSNSKQFKVH
ncbi:MAG: hypothetical protein ABFD18_03360 [Syntrophomonas sp.]